VARTRTAVAPACALLNRRPGCAAALPAGALLRYITGPYRLHWRTYTVARSPEKNGRSRGTRRHGRHDISAIGYHDQVRRSRPIRVRGAYGFAGTATEQVFRDRIRTDRRGHEIPVRLR